MKETIGDTRIIYVVEERRYYIELYREARCNIPRGWGVISLGKTREKAIELAQMYAKKYSGTYTGMGSEL